MFERRPYFHTMAETQLLDPDLILTEINNFTDKIYELGETKNDKVVVGVEHILKKYKGKPEQASKLILSTLGLFKNATAVIKQIKKEIMSLQKQNDDLQTVKSFSEVTEKTGRTILKYVEENLHEKTKLLDKSVEQLKSYSEALKTNSEATKSSIKVDVERAVTKALDNHPPATIRNIKSAVRDVIHDSQDVADRSKNIILFGVEKEPDLDVECTTGLTESILYDIGFDLSIEQAERFGKETDGKPQPIRVSFKDKSLVHEILKSAKKLTTSEKYKNVYISIDRNKEQQKLHRDLVSQLKKKIKETPERYWYIKNDKIYSEEKDISHIQRRGDD